jgi:hypothetical protein
VKPLVVKKVTFRYHECQSQKPVPTIVAALLAVAIASSAVSFALVAFTIPKVLVVVSLFEPCEHKNIASFHIKIRMHATILLTA